MRGGGADGAEPNGTERAGAYPGAVRWRKGLSELLPGPRSIDPFRGKRRLSRVENLAGSSQRRSFCPFPSLFRGSGKGPPWAATASWDCQTALMGSVLYLE